MMKLTSRILSISDRRLYNRTVQFIAGHQHIYIAYFKTIITDCPGGCQRRFLDLVNRFYLLHSCMAYERKSLMYLCKTPYRRVTR